ncbi:MAG: hypothetical protein V3W18_13995 [candidate division Zixibacteria bacterium]
MKKSGLIAAIIAILFLFAGLTFSIPSFSSKEGVNCLGCHNGYPRLNNQGLEYLAGGYSFDSKQSDTAPGFRISGAVESWFVSKKEGRSTDFQLHKFELLSGGRLSKNAYYFAEAYFEERGGFHNLGDVFITLTPTSSISAKAGQFQPDLILTDSERLTTRRSMLYNTKVNGWRLRNRQRGVAITFNQDRFSLTGAVVNGNGNGVESDDESDNNDHKDMSLALSTSATDHITLGGYLYKGEIPGDDEISRYVFNYRQFLLDGRLELNGALGYGENSDPNGDGIDQKSLGYFVEGVYAVRQEFLVLARYDYFDPNSDIDNDHNWDIVPAILYYLGENIRISGEYVFFKENRNDEFRAVLSAVF